MQALRFKVSWVQQLTLNQNTFSFSFPVETLQAKDATKLTVSCWTCCQLLIEIHWLIPCIFSQIWSSSPVWWFTIFLEICLSNSCCLYPVAFRWTLAGLLFLSVEPMLCFQSTLIFIRALDLICCAASKIAFHSASSSQWASLWTVSVVPTSPGKG